MGADAFGLDIVVCEFIIVYVFQCMNSFGNFWHGLVLTC